MPFKLRDHKEAIFFVAVAILVVILLLALLNYAIEINPLFVPQMSGFVQNYGLFAGFATAAVGSIWFVPFPYEVVVIPVMKFYHPTIIAILVISAGATLADIFNFYSGQKIGEHLVKKRVEKKTFARIQKFFEKYGVLTLVIFSFLGPVTSYDVAAFAVGGFSKMRMRHFIPITFACRVIHFAFALMLANTVLKIGGVPL